MEILGEGNCGSAKAPTATMTRPGSDFNSQKTVEAHVWQKWNCTSSPSSTLLTHAADLPSTHMAASSNLA
jgi:hypothetical protein